MFSHSNRSFWSVLAFIVFLVIMLSLAFAAVYQARLLRDATVDIQRQLVPFSRGVVELEANLTALRGSDALLRSQSENNDSDSAELLRAHSYMAQVLDELVALQALDLGDAQHIALYTLQSQVTRYQRQHDEFTALVSAAKYDKAVDYYDTALAAHSVDIAGQVSDFIALNRRLQQNSAEVAVAAYTVTYWAIVGCVGAALAASLLMAGCQMRRSSRWQRRSSGAAVHAALS